MADGLTFIIRNEHIRERLLAFIASAPLDTVVTAKPDLRTIPQNAKMQALLGELALAKPDGRTLPPHKWKALAMDAAGKKPDWERSLDGQSIVCVGYKSSRLTKDEMGEVIEAIYAYGAERGVAFSQ